MRTGRVIPVFHVRVGVKRCKRMASLYKHTHEVEKNKENNLIFGALGNIWRHNFYMGMQNDMSLEK